MKHLLEKLYFKFLHTFNPSCAWKQGFNTFRWKSLMFWHNIADKVNSLTDIYSQTCYSGQFFSGTSRITVKLSQKNPYIADSCYSGSSFLASYKKFKLNLSTYSEHPISFKGKTKINCHLFFNYFYLIHYFTFTISELPTFRKAFLSQVIILNLRKKCSQLVFPGQI